MLVAIHKDAHSADPYTQVWADSLAEHNIDTCWIDLAAPGVLRDVRQCDGLMWHWGKSDSDRRIARSLTTIELELKIPVFPNHRSSWHRRDKLSQYYLLESLGAPMPRTWVFWDKQSAMEWALQADYPKVFKLSAGGGGKDVIMVSGAKEACSLIELMFGYGIGGWQHRALGDSGNTQLGRKLGYLGHRCKAAMNFAFRGRPPFRQSPERGYAYFQEFIPGNSFSTSVSVIGDRAFGSISFNRTHDFRSSGKDLDYDPSVVNLDCVRLALDLSRRAKFSIMAYDILMHGDVPVVLEMNFRNGKRSGYWTQNLNWVDKPILPQEAQVEVFLDIIRFEKNRRKETPFREYS